MPISKFSMGLCIFNKGLYLWRRTLMSFCKLSFSNCAHFLYTFEGLLLILPVKRVKKVCT